MMVITEGERDVLQVPRAGKPRRVLKSSVAPAPGPRHRRFLRGVLRILEPVVKIDPEILYINVERKFRSRVQTPLTEFIMIDILVVAKIDRKVQQIVCTEGITCIQRNQRPQNKIRFGVVPGKVNIVIPVEFQ